MLAQWFGSSHYHPLEQISKTGWPLEELTPYAFTTAHSISDDQPQVVLVFFHLYIYGVCSNILCTVLDTVEKMVGKKDTVSLLPMLDTVMETHKLTNN